MKKIDSASIRDEFPFGYAGVGENACPVTRGLELCQHRQGGAIEREYICRGNADTGERRLLLPAITKPLIEFRRGQLARLILVFESRFKNKIAHVGRRNMEQFSQVSATLLVVKFQQHISKVEIDHRNRMIGWLHFRLHLDETRSTHSVRTFVRARHPWVVYRKVCDDSSLELGRSTKMSETRPK